ncbi:hypothetical protein FHS96_004591 [Sphingomonas zeicaulis]|uniref:hypothetical protein n=1 Tax=Sphingomonas zeicaulis TaxID=1632740 RepID=UPI003D22739B
MRRFLLQFRSNRSIDKIPFGVFFRLVEPRASVTTAVRRFDRGNRNFGFLTYYLNGQVSGSAGQVSYVDRMPVERPTSGSASPGQRIRRLKRRFRPPIHLAHRHADRIGHCGTDRRTAGDAGAAPGDLGLPAEASPPATGGRRRQRLGEVRQDRRAAA